MGQLKGPMDFLLRHWVRFCSPERGQSTENLLRFHLKQLALPGFQQQLKPPSCMRNLPAHPEDFQGLSCSLPCAGVVPAFRNVSALTIR